uniref:Histone-lysine N-methyltransferase, H3 lysine-79 specific n=1 Tax=Parastrongyloides trichosuri TaxID=131310 RepID=A0A0N4Z1V7_PARTI
MSNNKEVPDNHNNNKKVGDDIEGAPKTEKKLKLCSPYGGESLYYFWNYEEKYKNKNKAIVVEIVDLVRTTKHKIKEIHDILKQHGHDLKTNEPYFNLDNLRILCRTFNKAVKHIGETYHGIPKSEAKLGSNSEQFQEIINRVYNKAVVDVNALNKHYGAFSSETYGETTWKRMATILEDLKLNDKDVFVDLGSGVGQIVCQVSGSSKVGKAVGIEVADLPAKYARRMEFEFSRMMRWHNKKFRQFKLHHGNFLDQKFRKLITEEATVIFINNYAFHEKLNMEIKRNLLCDLKDGVKVISTKPFVIHKEISERTLNDVSSIMDITEFKPINCPASWTNKHVPYFLQTVNRARLLEYFNKQKKAKELREMKEVQNSRASSVSSTKHDSHVEKKDTLESKEVKHKEGKSSKEHTSERKNSIKDHKEVSGERRNSKDNINKEVKKHKENVIRTGSLSSHDGKDEVKESKIPDDDIEVFYGATTRKKWKAIIGETNVDKDKSNTTNPEPVDSEMRKKSNSDLKDKPKMKHGQRGRPKKVNSEESKQEKVDKITQEDKETLEIMQKMSEEAVVKVSHEKINDDSLVETSLMIEDHTTDDEKDYNKDEFDFEVDTIEEVIVPYIPSRDPEIVKSLDQVLELQKEEFLKFIDYMYSGDFKRLTELKILKQRQLKESKVQKINALKAMIALQQEEGKQLLTTRIKEVGIDAKTAPEFIDAAKLIVETNKIKQKRLANLEKDIAAAEKAHEEYQAKILAKEAQEKSINDVVNSVANENIEDSIDSIINSVANNSLPSSNSESYCNTPIQQSDYYTQKRNSRGRSVIRVSAPKKGPVTKKCPTDKITDCTDVESQVENILKKIQNQSKEQESLKSLRIKSEAKKRTNTVLPSSQISNSVIPAKKKRSNGSLSTPKSPNSSSNFENSVNNVVNQVNLYSTNNNTTDGSSF